MSITALKALQDNYIWIIQQMSSFICIDPGDPKPVLEYAQNQGLKLSAMLITHYHQDHIGGVKHLLHSFPAAELYEPEQDLQSIFLAPYQFNILRTPGHTKDHICFFEPNQKWLFCGDTLFSGGCGRVFSGTHQALYESLLQLKHLPDDTLIYCAHEYTLNNLKFALTVESNNQQIQSHLKTLSQSKPVMSLPSTLSLEKQINPFLRLDSPEVQAWSGTTDPFLTFKKLRDAKDCF